MSDATTLKFSSSYVVLCVAVLAGLGCLAFSTVGLELMRVSHNVDLESQGLQEGGGNTYKQDVVSDCKLLAYTTDTSVTHTKETSTCIEDYMMESHWPDEVNASAKLARKLPIAPQDAPSSMCSKKFCFAHGGAHPGQTVQELACGSHRGKLPGYTALPELPSPAAMPELPAPTLETPRGVAAINMLPALPPRLHTEHSLPAPPQSDHGTPAPPQSDNLWCSASEVTTRQEHSCSGAVVLWFKIDL